MGSRIIIPWTPPALVAERCRRADDAVVIDVVAVEAVTVVVHQDLAGVRLYASIDKSARYSRERLNIFV